MKKSVETLCIKRKRREQRMMRVCNRLQSNMQYLINIEARNEQN